MPISAFDLFTIGIGPSSSHTVGPMRAAKRFVDGLQQRGELARTARVKSEMFGSLGLTGKGHGTDKAVLLGLEGETPEGVPIDDVPARLTAIREGHRLRLGGTHEVSFAEADDLLFARGEFLPLHPNGMRFTAFDAEGTSFRTRVYYSIGGGFVVTGEEMGGATIAPDTTVLPHPFRTGKEMLEQCRVTGLPVSGVMMKNELAWRSEEEIRAQLTRIHEAMKACVRRGCETEGELPGGLKVKRRAPAVYKALVAMREKAMRDPLTVMDWVNLYALAVNEENAAGGRVVTAPTNGAAGIIPAVLHYYENFWPQASLDGVHRFLLTAAAIGILYKENASISGAEVGCQGEVGVACSMAAGALAEVCGGSVAQVENAAEIGMEHNLGLTCDPIGGLVQIPCIERNAMGSIKAINACRIALAGDGSHFVSLDKVIITMRQTGADMQSKYKETSRGGLAVNVVEC